MASTAEYVSTVRTVLEKSRVSKDSRIKDSFILSEINIHRSVKAQQDLERHQRLDPVMIQNMGALDVTQITSVDDPNVLSSSIVMGKVKIPEILALTNDKGAYSVRTTSGDNAFIRKEYNQFWEIPSGHIADCFQYFFRIHDFLYIYPYKKQIRAMLVLQNPLDGYVIDQTAKKSGELIYATNWAPAEQYIVESGQITVLQGSTKATFTAGQTFTPTNADYDGTAVVKLANGKRKMTWEDTYPMPGRMMDYVSMKIWKETFGLEDREIADIKNDATDQVHLVQDEQTSR